MKLHRFLPAWFPKTLLSALAGGMFLISVAQAQIVTTEVGLSDAIAQANLAEGDVTITLGNDISLTTVLPPVIKASGTLTIEGGSYTLSRSSGAAAGFQVLAMIIGTVNISDLTISGGSSSRGAGVFVGGSATSVTLTNCTVSGNTSVDFGDGRGGGVFALMSASVTLINSTVSGNTADFGGGICATGSGTSVTLTNSTVSGNTADYGGGGIYALDSSNLTLTNSTVSDNTTNNEGGGICALNSGTSVTLTNSTISGNTANAGGGCYAASANVTFDNSTVSGNTAAYGGGIYADANSVDLGNSTVSGNTAAYDGGGIYANGCSVTLSNITVSGNTADSGGGVYADYYSDVTLTRSIISGNSAVSWADEVLNNLSTLTADAYNVLGHSGRTLSQSFFSFTPGASDVVCTSDGSNATALSSILNATLADNGGLTLTHALVAGSPAIDIGSTGPATDQRGIIRPQGAGVDAGAYEFVPSNGPTDPDPDPDPIREFNYSHTLVSNTAKLNAWVMDPEGRLGVGANWIMEGDLSRGFRFVDGMLVGMFDTTGMHTFRVSGTDGTITVNHSFTVRVMVPTVCPTIFGAWINGDYLSIEVLEEARHGVAAQTSPMHVTLELGQAAEIRFDWDTIKDDFGFCIIDGTLPAGLVLDGRSGVISGVPSASGVYRFLISVKDWRGRGYQWVEVSIK